MNSKRPWIIAGVTTFALAGFGAAAAMASDDGTVHDRQPAPVVQKYDAPQTQNGVVDNSPESADSPTASVVDSADSVDPALDTADSPDDRAAAAPIANVNKDTKVAQDSKAAKDTKVTKAAKTQPKPQAPKKKAPVDSADSTGSA